MVRKIGLAMLLLALTGANMPVQAVVTPRVKAAQELVSFQKLIKQSLIAYQTDQHAEPVLASCIERDLQHVREHVEEQDLRNLYNAASHLDTVLSEPNPDRGAQRCAITVASRALVNQSSELLCKLGTLCKYPERQVAQQLSKRQKRLLGHGIAAHHAQTNNQNPIDMSQENYEEMPQDGASILAWLMNNPRIIALGAAGLYGLLARYFDWPPFGQSSTTPAPAAGAAPRTGPDAAAPGPDAAAPGPDAAAPGPDAAAPGPDAAAPGPDAAAPGPDAAAPEPDAAHEPEETYESEEEPAQSAGCGWFSWIPNWFKKSGGR